MKLADVKNYIKEVIKDNLDEAKHHQYPNSVFYSSENDGLKKALDKIEEYEKSRMTITKVSYNINDRRGGCPTCDYGSRYIRDIYIEFNGNIESHFHSNLRIDSCISESDWIMAILKYEDLDDIIIWFKEKMVPVVKEEVLWRDRNNTESDVYYEVIDKSGEGVIHTRHYIGVDD